MAACGDFQTSQERKLECYLTIWSTLMRRGKKKVNAAYIRLMRYSTNIDIYIERDITTFLEKLLKVILFLIIPINSTKYLVSFCSFTLCPTSRRRLYFYFIFSIAFWETALKVQTRILIVLCSIYMLGCMIDLEKKKVITKNSLAQKSGSTRGEIRPKAHREKKLKLK